VVLFVAFMLIRSVVRDGKRATWEILRVVCLMIGAGLVRFSAEGRIGAWGEWLGAGCFVATLIISLIVQRAISRGRLFARGVDPEGIMTSKPGRDIGIETLLSQYPGPVVLRPGKLRLAGFVLLGAGFIVAGAYMVRSHADYGWFVFSFSALCTIILVASVLSGLSLTLDSEGFQKEGFGRVRRSDWRSVTNIHAAGYAPAQTKSVCYLDSSLNNGRPANTLGYNAMLSSTFGMSGDDLASLMTRWQSQALGRYPLEKKLGETAR
jgi:hypothetical protein